MGIRWQGKLVAMAGERLKVPGYTELSAVCTHPEHTGKGYGGMLTRKITEGISRSRGDSAPSRQARQNAGGRAV
jgi:predicted GNAT family acetyltransferase